MISVENSVVQLKAPAFYHCGFDPSFNKGGTRYEGPQYDINRFSLERDEYREEKQEPLMPLGSPIQTVERAISQITTAIIGDNELFRLIGECKKAEEELSREFFLGFGVDRSKLDDRAKKAAEILEQRATQYLIRPKEDAFLAALGNLYAKFYTDRVKVRRFPREVLEIFYAASRPQNEEWFMPGVKNFDLSRNGAKMGGVEFASKRGEVGDKAVVTRQDSFKCNPFMWQRAAKLIIHMRELRRSLRNLPSQGYLKCFSAAELERVIPPLKEGVKKVKTAWQYFVASDLILSRCQGLHSQSDFFVPWYEALKNESDIPYLAHLLDSYSREMPDLVEAAAQKQQEQCALTEEKQRIERERDARYAKLTKNPHSLPPKEMERTYKDDIWHKHIQKVELVEKESKRIADRSRFIGGETDRIMDLLEEKKSSSKGVLAKSVFKTYMRSIEMDRELKDYPLSFIPYGVDPFEIAKLNLVGSIGELFISCPNYSEKELYVEVFDALIQIIPKPEYGKELYSLLGELVVKFPAEDVWMLVDLLSSRESGRIRSFLQLFRSIFSLHLDLAASPESKEQLLACFFLLSRANLDGDSIKAIKTMVASYRERSLLSPFLNLILMMPLEEWLKQTLPLEEFASKNIEGVEEKIFSAMREREGGEELCSKVSRHLTDLISLPYPTLVKKAIAHFEALLAGEKIHCSPEQLRVFNRAIFLMNESELKRANSPYRVYRQVVLQQYRVPVSLPDERYSISIIDDGVQKKMTVWKVQNLRSSCRRKLEASFENKKIDEHQQRGAVYQFSDFIFDCIQEAMCDCFDDPKLIEALSGSHAINNLDLHKSYLISRWHKSVGFFFGSPTFRFDIFAAPLHAKLAAADEQTFLNAFFQIFTTKRVVEKIVDRAEVKFQLFSEFVASFAELMKMGETKKLSACLEIDMRPQITYNITKLGALESLKLLGYQRLAILPEERVLRDDFLF